MDDFNPNKKKLNVLGNQPVVTKQPTVHTEPPATVKRSKRLYKPTKRLLPYGILAVVALSLPVGIWQYQSYTSQKNAIIASVVPDSVIKSVSFKIYYPDQTKLPKGYVFDKRSITTPVQNGVSYSVDYPGGNKIVFSLQLKPSDSELQSFKTNFIPLRNEVRTSLGQADIGAYNQQTLVSFPLNDGPWIVITAPSDIDQDKLKQVLNSLTL